MTKKNGKDIGKLQNIRNKCEENRTKGTDLINGSMYQSNEK